MPTPAPDEYPPALFLTSQEGVEATELTRGPWSHGVMHGGPICGLMSWGIERELAREDLMCSRYTVEILSGVPVDSLGISANVVKDGKRTAVVEASISHQGRVVARATSQWLSRPTEPSANQMPVPAIPLERADPGAHPDMEYPRPGFNADAVELRVVSGSTEESGPGLIWARLDHELIAGESTSKFQQVATLSDLGAAVGWEHADDEQAFINPDVTLQLLRLPISEWILFDSAVERSSPNLACCRTTLADEAGVIGWVLQSQMVAPEEIQL